MAKKKEWQEGEMIVAFNLTKIDSPASTPVMTEWLDVSDPEFDIIDAGNFQRLLPKIKRIANWKEEDLKMKFIFIITFLRFYKVFYKRVGQSI